MLAATISDSTTPVACLVSPSNVFDLTYTVDGGGEQQNWMEGGKQNEIRTLVFFCCHKIRLYDYLLVCLPVGLTFSSSF